MDIAKRRGQQKAIMALARRLAVIMHRMWVEGTDFRWTREAAPDAVTAAGFGRRCAVSRAPRRPKPDVFKQ
jgi:hypothetical protein